MKELTFYDSEDRPWPNERLSNAAIVGHTTSKTTKIWVRMKLEGEFWLILAEEEIPVRETAAIKHSGTNFQNLMLTSGDNSEVRIRGCVKSNNFANGSDRTAVYNVSALKPGKRYYYAVFSKTGEGDLVNWIIGRDEIHSFRTDANKPDEIAFGLISCHMPYDKRNLVNMEMWQTFGEILGETNADFIIAGGDQAYSDGNPNVSIWAWLKRNKKEVQKLNQDDRREVMTSWYRDIYRGYWGPLDLRRVYRNFPTYMIWDDHEIMDGWGSYKDSELSNKLDSIWEWENQGKNLALAHDMFWASRKVYEEYQNCHNPATAKGQWDYAFEKGDCAFFVMDMRGQRDYNREKNKILGADQLNRVLKWLDGPKVAKAAVAFIVSPVPMVHADKYIVNNLDLNAFGLADDLRDEWEHESNWEERDKILKKVFKLSHDTGKRVLFLSGDVHIGAAFRLSRKNRGNARVYQLTSSAITYYLSDLRRNALELIVRKNGVLGAKKGAEEKNLTKFSLFHIFKQNNFGIIRVKKNGASVPDVSWELYGNNSVEDMVVRTKTLKL